MPALLHTLRLGLAQLLVEGGEPTRNLERADALVADAAAQGCDVVLLPETLDFGWTHPSALTEAHPIPGPFSDHFGALARTHGCYLCLGLTEQEAPGRRFNTALLIDPDGRLLLRYRKINLLPVELPFYGVGRQLAVAQTPLGCLGVNICADNYADGLPLGHALARMGAQVLLSPSSWTVGYDAVESATPYQDKWLHPFQTLASAYDLVVASATSVGYIVGGPYEGMKMVGCSLAVGPDGVLASGPYNEFAGALTVVDVPVYERPAVGTALGQQLHAKGFRFAPRP